MNAGEVLCRVGDLPEEGVCEVGAGLIAWRRGAEVRVFANRCPHFGIPLNYEPGKLETYGGLLMCVHHYSYFRFPDGACVAGPSEGRPLEPVAVRIEGGLVYLA